MVILLFAATRPPCCNSFGYSKPAGKLPAAAGVGGCDAIAAAEGAVEVRQVAEAGVVGDRTDGPAAGSRRACPPRSATARFASAAPARSMTGTSRSPPGREPGRRTHWSRCPVGAMLWLR